LKLWDAFALPYIGMYLLEGIPNSFGFVIIMMGWLNRQDTSYAIASDQL